MNYPNGRGGGGVRDGRGGGGVGDGRGGGGVGDRCGGVLHSPRHLSLSIRSYIGQYCPFR